MPYERVGKCVYKKLSNGKLLKKPVGCSDSVPKAKAYLKTLYSVEEVNEALKPEVSDKAKQIFKAMIADRRDELMKRYGVKAEMIAYGKAVIDATALAKKNEKSKEMKDGKLKEMIKSALKTPISKKEEVYEWKRDLNENPTGAMGKKVDEMMELYNKYKKDDITKEKLVKKLDEFTGLLDFLEIIHQLRAQKQTNVDEGTCGYSIDGEGDTKPAGSHLLKKKIKEIIQNKINDMNEDKDWIQKAIKRPGALHKELGIKPGEKIPKSKINKAISKLKKKDKDKEKEGTQLGAADERELKQLTLAKTLSKFNENELVESILAKLRKK